MSEAVCMSFSARGTCPDVFRGKVEAWSALVGGPCTVLAFMPSPRLGTGRSKLALTRCRRTRGCHRLLRSWAMDLVPTSDLGGPACQADDTSAVNVPTCPGGASSPAPSCGSLLGTGLQEGLQPLRFALWGIVGLGVRGKVIRGISWHDLLLVTRTCQWSQLESVRT